MGSICRRVLKTLTLPRNANIRILAVSVAEENPETEPVQPLYDVLPSPHAGAPDFSLSAPYDGFGISRDDEHESRPGVAERQLRWQGQAERFRGFRRG